MSLIISNTFSYVGVDPFSGTYWRSQTFQHTANFTLTSVILNMKKLVGGSPGTITLDVKAVDVDGKPTGSALVSSTTNGNTLPDSSFEERTFTFSRTVLTGNTTYALVIHSTAGPTGEAYCNGSESSTYSNGKNWRSSDSGSSWTEQNQDWWFKINGVNPWVLNNTTTGTDSNTYTCKNAHDETDDTVPITGDDWADYWALGSELKVRMMPFIYSSSIAYQCEFGDKYIRFYYDGALLET